MEGGNHYKRGLWTVDEDKILMDYIRMHGKGRWNRVAKMTGLNRCGKSCRLRWINYLSPNVKRGDFSEEEDDLIIRLHNLLGNRWSLIAGRVPGRTDNQVKNHWNTHLSKKLGIKKEKNKAAMSRHTGECRQLGETTRLPKTSNSKLPTIDGDDEAVGNKVNEGSQNDVEAFDTQEPTMNESYASSFWFSIDNLNHRNPNLMEFLDGYPLDTV